MACAELNGGWYMRYLELADVLRAEGLTVVEESGWTTRGWRSGLGWATPEMKAGELLSVDGVVVHDTGTEPTASWGSQLYYIAKGSDIAPIAQLFLRPDGVVHVVASGLANHAGASRFRYGVRTHQLAEANSNLNPVTIGMEMMKPAAPNLVWPKVQVDAAIHATAAVLAHKGLPVEAAQGHFEVAINPVGRKVDPRGTWAQGGNFWDNPNETDPAKRTMNGFRFWVGAVLLEKQQPAPPPPPPAPSPVPNPAVQTYVVVAGDGWYRVARNLGATLEDELDANGATITTPLRPGDVLAWPGRSIKVLPGDGWISLSRRAFDGDGKRWQELKALNGNKPLRPGDILRVV